MSATIVLENGVNLSECMTTGSLLEINNIFQDSFEEPEVHDSFVPPIIDTIGQPIASFEVLEKSSISVDELGFVKKKILEEGGGSVINECCTVSVAFSGYWENEQEPFDITTLHKPLHVNIKDNSLLPGLQMAIKSMLVGELSVFLLSYHVMFGVMGNPPKIKPKAKCVYYIKLVKSILTPKDGELNFSEPNIFHKVHKEVRHLYMHGIQLHHSKNYSAAVQLFKRSTDMLHRCRLADEKEELVQQKLLLKLYMNLAICHNKMKQPYKACIACNELNNISNIWSNGKALFQKAKALRMIGEFKQAEKKLTRAMSLFPNNEEMIIEMELLQRIHNSFNQTKMLIMKEYNERSVTNDFKSEIDKLIQKFKEDVNICRFTLPPGLSIEEMEYVKEACKNNNIFCNRQMTLDKSNNDDCE